MYKEYHDTTLNSVVDQMYMEMASRHCVRSPCIEIIKPAMVDLKLCKTDNTKQLHNSKIKFLLVFQKVRPPPGSLRPPRIREPLYIILLQFSSIPI
jgi:large subunit ribosomal protein L18Ae